MRRLQALLVLATLLCATSRTHADSAPTSVVVPTSLVVAGGVSLGSYQAGFLYYYSEYLKANNVKLAAVTGASAGSINATIAAIESCRRQQADPTQSPYWKVWIPVGLDELLPEDGSSVTPLGLLQRKPLENAASYLQEYLAHKDVAAETAAWVDGECRVPIGIVATRLAPESVRVPVAAQRATERFGVVFDKNLEGRLAHMADCKFAANGFVRAADQPQCDRNDLSVRHPGSSSGLRGAPTFADLRALMFASSSFPLAFEPMPLTSHDRVDASATTDLYVDGGIFDNIPVAFAESLMADPEHTSCLNPHNPTSTDTQIPTSLDTQDPASINRQIATIVVDSDNTPWKPTEHATETYGSIIDAAAAFARGFVSAARTRELLQVEQRRSVLYPERRAMLTSDYLFAFSGFLDQSFREFDFYLGMLDARSFVRRVAPETNTVDAFERTGIQSPAFDCFKKLEIASMGFQQVPDWDKSVAECIGSQQTDEQNTLNGESKKLLDLITLFDASVDTQQFAVSASRPSQLEVFRRFLGKLDARGFKFSLHGHTFPAEDLVYQLRRVSGWALSELAGKQPGYANTIHLLTDITLDLALFHIMPDFYFSLGVHLNRGFDVDTSWGLGESRVDRLGFGFRLRKFSVLEKPVAGTPSLNLLYAHSFELWPWLGLELGSELGLGYRFGEGGRDEHGNLPPENRSGVRQVVAFSVAGVGYDLIYVRVDTRLYSRMSRHWPSDYADFEFGLGIGWRFH